MIMSMEIVNYAKPQLLSTPTYLPNTIIDRRRTNLPLTRRSRRQSARAVDEGIRSSSRNPQHAETLHGVCEGTVPFPC